MGLVHVTDQVDTYSAPRQSASVALSSGKWFNADASYGPHTQTLARNSVHFEQSPAGRVGYEYVTGGIRQRGDRGRCRSGARRPMPVRKRRSSAYWRSACLPRRDGLDGLGHEHRPERHEFSTMGSMAAVSIACGAEWRKRCHQDPVRLRNAAVELAFATSAPLASRSSASMKPIRDPRRITVPYAR